MDIPIESQALNILRNYTGDNDLIKDLKIQVFKRSVSLTLRQYKYIIKYAHIKPKYLNDKVVKIHPHYGDKLAIRFKLDKTPTHIIINKILATNVDDHYLHIWGKPCEDYPYNDEFLVGNDAFIKLKKIPAIDWNKYDRKPFDHQLPAIYALMSHSKFILADDMGLGKAEYVKNKVFTPNGRKEIGKLKIGDQVIGSDGKPYNVKGIFPQGEKPLYRVTFNDGSSILCCDEHLWSVMTKSQKNRKLEPITLSVKQLLDQNLTITRKGKNQNDNKFYKISTFYKEKNGDNKWCIPIAEPIEFYNNDNLPIDPYFLGLLIGDGGIKSGSVTFSTIDEELINNIKNVLSENLNIKKQKGDNCDYRIVDKRRQTNQLMDDLRQLELYGKSSYDKFIPSIYKYSKIKDRLAILQGLMDTDGSYLKNKKNGFGSIEFSTSSEQLANDVIEIVNSLGGITRKRSRIPKYTYKGEQKLGKISYRINIKLPENMNPFRLERKRQSYVSPTKYKPARYIKNIEFEKNDEAVCISVDSPDKLYVTEHAIVTHNTTSAVLAALESKFERILIVCPATLKINWSKEISFYDNPDDVSIISSNVWNPKKWTIINYDILKNFHHMPVKGKKLPDIIKSPIDYNEFDLVIADEAHYLKNSASNRTKLFNSFASNIPNIWFLTGTPITNKPIDFYNMLNICECPIAHDWSYYAKQFCEGKQYYRTNHNGKGKKKYWVASGASNLQQLNASIQDVMLRRTKRDSLDLPQKTTKPIYLDLSYSVLYREYVSQYEKWAGENPDVSLSDHLRQLMEIRTLLSYDKVEHTIKVAEEIMEMGKKVIIFSCFTDSITRIHEHFGKSSLLIDGSVTKAKREAAVELFQTDSKKTVLCGNIIAAGVGLTLTEAEVVIFNDLDWTPANHSQAEDRAYRIGQVNPVHIIYMLFDDSLDTMMYKSLDRKKRVIAEVLGDNIVDTNELKESVAEDVINQIKEKLFV